jgi:penicillin-binding protein A
MTKERLAMKNRITIIGIFTAWMLLVTGAFLKISLSYDPFFNSARNFINRHMARGVIKDRNGQILAYGSGLQRKYVLGTAGSPIIGIARPDVGVEGYIEREFGERLLSNKKSKLFYTVMQNDEGYPLTTTIDKRLQLSAFQAMSGFQGAIVIMKLNGEVVTSVSTKSFDPNRASSRYYDEIRKSSERLLVNRALDGKYEPGSAWKTVVAISLLEKGSQGKPVVCNGQLRIGNKTIRCMHSHGAVRDMTDAFAKSCNIWFMKNALAELDADTMKKSFSPFMARKINKDLGQEDRALAAIGQGEILVSPMELCQLAAAVANKGLKPEPRFVKEKLVTTRVMDEKTAVKLTDMMTQVVTRGTAKGLSIFIKNGYQVAAKTGTAERDTANGKINTAVLIGFAGHGKDKPEIAFSMVVEDAKGVSGAVCVPRIKDVLESYLSQRNN